jgi:hypothetical protein
MFHFAQSVPMHLLYSSTGQCICVQYPESVQRYMQSVQLLLNCKDTYIHSWDSLLHASIRVIEHILGAT